MENYSNYFFERSDQILVLGCVAFMWVGFRYIGAGIMGRERLFEVDHLVGWAVVSTIFTFGGVFFDISFTSLSWISMALAIGLAGVVVYRDGFKIPINVARLFVLFLPLLVLVSAMRGSQWDEFSTWLVVPQFLLVTDQFPDSSSKIPGQALIAYPYSWNYLSYLVGRLTGRFFENSGSLSNVFLLLGFAVLSIKLISIGLGRNEGVKRPSWALCAIAAITVSLANPTFAQKVVLTAYADVASAITTAVAAILGWFLIEALIEGQHRLAQKYALQMGAVFLVLVNLKQSTLVLFILVVIAVSMVVMRDNRIRFWDYVRCLPAIVLPPILIYLAWRYYVNLELSSRELSVLPFDSWALVQIPVILWAMLVVLAKKGFYLFLMVVIVGFGVRGFWRNETPFDRFSAILAAIILAYSAFLFFIYVSVFGENSGPKVYSYWRYNMHLGFLFVAFVSYGGAIFWRRYEMGQYFGRRTTVLPVILIIIAPFVFAKKLRFDKVPTITHFRHVASEVAKKATKTDLIYAVDPTGSGESGVITGYEVGQRATYRGYISAFHRDKLSMLRAVLKDNQYSMIIFYSYIREFDDVLGMSLDTEASHLLQRQGNDHWKIVDSWPLPR